MRAKISASRHLRAALLVIALLSLGLGITAYVAWTRVSALMVLRWFVRETGIPAEVRSANWDARLRELLDGTIRDLKVDFGVGGTDVALETPVDFVRAGSHWSLRLAPRIQVASYPPVQGTLAVEFDVERKGAAPKVANLAVELHLKEVRPLALKNTAGEVTARSWTVDGWIQWAAVWLAHLELRFNDVSARGAGGALVTAKAVEIVAEPTWPDNPPLPVEAKTTLAATDLSLIAGDVLVSEPTLSAVAAFRFDGKAFEHVDVSVDKPVRLAAKGSFVDGVLDAAYTLKGSLDALYNQRATQWLAARAPLLRGSSAKGALRLDGRLNASPAHGFSATGRLALRADTVDFPVRDFGAKGVVIDMPLVFPGTPGWGSVAVQSATYHSITLKNLALEARVGQEGVDLTTEGADGDDRPIKQSVWGGSIDVEDLYAHFGGPAGTQFTAAVNGGPFSLPAIQSDLCLVPDHPINGRVSLTYPKVVLDHDVVSLVGDTNAEAFNGRAHVGDIQLQLGQRSTKIFMNIEWDDLDLHQVGLWTNLGDIRGSLFGSLDNARFTITPNGVFTSGYDFTFRGAPRGGSKVSFYGRAVQNILDMLGVQIEALPGYSGWVVKAMELWRNLMPAHADVMGFRAVADEDWTTLTTFEPGDDADASCRHEKLHYILCGTGFTIPLNSYGTYPMRTRTSSFHAWLNRIAASVEKQMAGTFNSGQKKNAEKPKCEPFF